MKKIVFTDNEILKIKYDYLVGIIVVDKKNNKLIKKEI